MTPQPATALPVEATTPESPAPDQAPLTVQPILAVSKTDGTNGTPIPPASRPTRSRVQSKRNTLLLYIAAAVLVVAGTAAAYVFIEKPFTRVELMTVLRSALKG